jgi:hypothetical protein
VDKHFKFLTLPKSTGTVANIFIHGYSAGHDLEDRRTLAKSIPASLQDAVNIFAFWPSSHFARVDSASKGILAAAARVHPAAGAAALAVDRVAHFARIRSRAEVMGRDLMSQLESYLMKNHPYVDEVNLIGHSLGGRLVVSALKSLGPVPDHGLVIGEVLLMAAAVKVDPQDAAIMRSRIKGRLINAFSKDDWTLHLNLGESSLGRSAVEHFENIEIKGFGHGHYWKKLSHVMAQVSFKGYQAQQLAESKGSVMRFGDSVTDDSILYRVVSQSPVEVLKEAVKHLKSSSWTSIADNEKDLAYAFAREFQLVGGHCLVNSARGAGLMYGKVLAMLGQHYDLGSELHQCASVMETEALLIRKFFQHAFPDGHPLANAPVLCAREMARETYFRHIDALAERITVASYFKASTVDADMTDPAAGSSVVTGSTIGFSATSTLAALSGGLFGALGSIAKKPASRLITNMKTALKPGYSALIPAVAIVFYARLALDDEELM